MANNSVLRKFEHDPSFLNFGYKVSRGCTEVRIFKPTGKNNELELVETIQPDMDAPLKDIVFDSPARWAGTKTKKRIDRVCEVCNKTFKAKPPQKKLNVNGLVKSQRWCGACRSRERYQKNREVILEKQRAKYRDHSRIIEENRKTRGVYEEG